MRRSNSALAKKLCDEILAEDCVPCHTCIGALIFLALTAEYEAELHAARTEAGKSTLAFVHSTCLTFYVDALYQTSRSSRHQGVDKVADSAWNRIGAVLIELKRTEETWLGGAREHRAGKDDDVGAEARSEPGDYAALF